MTHIVKKYLIKLKSTSNIKESLQISLLKENLVICKGILTMLKLHKNNFIQVYPLKSFLVSYVNFENLVERTPIRGAQ